MSIGKLSKYCNLSKPVQIFCLVLCMLISTLFLYTFFLKCGVCIKDTHNKVLLSELKEKSMSLTMQKVVKTFQDLFSSLSDYY